MNTVKLGAVIPTMGTSHLLDAMGSLPPGTSLYLRDNRTDNWGVAKSWNWGIHQAITDGCNYILVTNDDVRYDPSIVLRLMEAFSVASDIVLTAAYNGSFNPDPWDHPNFSLFMIRSTFPEQVGWFDEHFWPAYWEDTDMHEQIKAKGLRTYTPEGAEFHHWGSTTIRENATLRALNNQTFERNKAYFLKKWGRISWP